jgi:hypothetical protein
MGDPGRHGNLFNRDEIFVAVISSGWNLFILFHRSETFFIFCLTGACPACPMKSLMLLFHRGSIFRRREKQWI